MTVRAPHQNRSRASLERIVSSTRALLEEKTFEELTIEEVVQRARSSVGVFYSRFGDKQALLEHLDERYAREVIDSVRAFVDGRDWDAAPLAERVEAVVRFMTDFHAERAGLVRALVLQARIRPGSPFAERSRRMNTTIPSLVRLLLERRADMGHTDPERAVSFGFFLVLCAVRERVLFPEGPASSADMSHAELVRELTRVWLACLGARE